MTQVALNLELANSSLTKTGIRIISRDEMNLAEFPLTVLSTRSNPHIKTLEFADTVRNKNGETVQRKWIITGADKFGLPTASDDEVLLGLLKLTVDRGFNERKVYFTRYELLRILRWTTEGRSYSRLQKALDRLSGVRIKATNAFYDNSSKAHSTMNFGLVDAYEINDARDQNPKPSFFMWSEALFKSFQAGFIKKLDLEFYLDLKSSVSKRLYRYLDKHFWYKSRVQINLFTLAHEKIGVSRTYIYASSIKQQLDPAVEELVQKGFLAGCEYIGKGSGTEVILTAASGKPRSLKGQDTVSPKKFSPMLAEQLPLCAKEELNDSAQDSFASVSKLLIERGIRADQTGRLLDGVDDFGLAKVLRIIKYFDQLIKRDSRLVSRSPVGFLYRAVEHYRSFVLPDAESKVSKKVVTKLEDKSVQMKTEYLVQRKNQLQSIKQSVEPKVLTALREEVEKALVKVRAKISNQRYIEAVDHAVDEKLAKLYAVSDFEEWLRGR